MPPTMPSVKKSVLSLLLALLAMRLPSHDLIVVFRNLSQTLRLTDLHEDANIALIRLIQLALLITVGFIYTTQLKPLYNAFQARISGTDDLVEKYGKWGIICGDLHHDIVQEYAKQLIEFGMHVLIVDSTSRCDSHDMELVRNLTSLAKESSNSSGNLSSDSSDEEYDSEEDDGDETIAVEYMNISSQKTDQDSPDNPNSNHDDDDDEHPGKHDMYDEAFTTSLGSKMGEMLFSGGLGVLIHCSSPSHELPHNPQEFETILKIASPYFIFRKTGAIISTSIGSCSSTSWNKNPDLLELVSPTSYKHDGGGVDWLRVTIPRGNHPTDDMIVAATWQMLGRGLELDMAFCKFVRRLDRIASKFAR